MKRLKFFQKDINTLSTYPLLADKDILTGQIELNTLDIKWKILSSEDEIIDSGIVSSIEVAKKLIKMYLKLQGVNFDIEKRKYQVKF